MSTATTENGNGQAMTTPAREPASLLNVIARALHDGTDLDRLEKLIAWQARITFDEAYALMWAELPQIGRYGKTDKYAFARIEDMDEQVRPILAQHGFSLQFRTVSDAVGSVHVYGELKRGGHSVTSDMWLPPDNGPGRNPLQSMGSAMSYAKRYITEDLLNLVRCGVDDDGAGSTPKRAPSSARPQQPAAPAAPMTPWAEDVDGRMAANNGQRWREVLIAGLGVAPTLADLDAIVDQSAGFVAKQVPLVRTEIAAAVMQARKRLAAPPVDKSTNQQKPKPPAPRQQAKPAEPERSAFATVIFDQFGEPGEAYTDPVVFARALVSLCRSAGDVEPLLSHNADGIADARHTHVAAAILAGIETATDVEQQENETEQTEPDSGEIPWGDGLKDHLSATERAIQREAAATRRASRAPVEPFVWQAIRPRDLNGRPSWPGWVAEVQDELVSIDEIEILAWTEAQRSVMAEAPLAQRATVVRAIIARFQELGRTPPSWLAELIAPQGQTKADKDRQWLDDRKADLDALPLDQSGRQAFDILVKNQATQTIMARLVRENPTLYQEARTAFYEKHEKLPKAAGTAGNG